jgi:ADP-ribose pyrophosphatase YjhB (NUDIX family)
MAKNLIPAKLYKKIVELVPILCVDVILKYHDKYALVKRSTEPLKGKWWLVGGRAFKGESTLRAAKRKVREETGLVAVDFEVVGVYEDHYKKSAWGVPASSVSVVYSAIVRMSESAIKLDKTITDIKMSKKLPNRFMKHLWTNQKFR